MAKNTSAIAAFQGMKADYAAATTSRFRRDRRGLYGTADAHYSNEMAFNRMRESVRDMDRNDALIGTTVDKAVQQHIQGGFRLDPQTGDKKLNQDLKDRFDDWSQDADACDIAGELEFPDMEELVLRHQFIDGDIFGLPLEDGQLQLIEADRCRTPTNSKRNIVLGVELDAYRRRQRYYFTKDMIDPLQRVQRVGDAPPYPARDEDGNKQVFHIFNPKRVTQTRGVTAFHAIFDISGMWEDTNFALLVKQQIAACFGLWLKRTAEGSSSDLKFGERDGVQLADGTEAIVEGMSPGQILRPPKGTELQAFSPNIPSTETMAHLRMLMQIIGVNIGLPLVLVMMDASETNFSGWRAAMDMARMGFRRNQIHLVRRFHKPVYGWKLRQWIAEDPVMRAAEARLGRLFYRHRWNTPTWPYIQPLDDARADSMRINNLLASPRQIGGENGRDFDDIVVETVEDNGSAIQRAIEEVKRIKTETGETVHWRDVLNRDVPKGGQTMDNLDEEPAPAKPAPAKTPGKAAA